MRVSEYDKFVRSTDQSAARSPDVRLDIATYGLASEVGSVVAAIKKLLLEEEGTDGGKIASTEIKEELGDTIWYLFALAQALNPEGPVNVFANDIENLRAEIGAGDERSEKIRGILGSDKRDEFLRASQGFRDLKEAMTFEDYQSLAILTARTESRTLAEVCLAVLWQLSAELFRRKLPVFERELNKGVVDRELNRVLGDIAWHVAALASVYSLTLSDVVEANVEKVRFRASRENRSPLHDEGCRETERFPRRFEVCFVTIGPGRTRLYFNGRRLGDDLTDNAYEDDGYRFHDVVHLACVAKLGWSPVFRKLMGRKRKSDPKKDEVEDGARAQIVEEAVIKAFHSEGVRLAGLTEDAARRQIVRLFPNRSDITFRFVKLINSFVAGLEVHQNRFWEWEDAIFEGYAIYDRLRREGQGTVVIDLEERSIIFTPTVILDIVGKIAGLGSVYVSKHQAERDERLNGLLEHIQDEVHGKVDFIDTFVRRLAILDALGVAQPTKQDFFKLAVVEVPGKGISVKAIGSVQQAMWDRRILIFRTTIAHNGTDGVYCNAVAVADD